MNVLIILVMTIFLQNSSQEPEHINTYLNSLNEPVLFQMNTKFNYIFMTPDSQYQVVIANDWVKNKQSISKKLGVFTETFYYNDEIESYVYNSAFNEDLYGINLLFDHDFQLVSYTLYEIKDLCQGNLAWKSKEFEINKTNGLIASTESIAIVYKYIKTIKEYNYSAESQFISTMDYLFDCDD